MANGFRSHFVYPQMSKANWYPGHMAKGMRRMAARVRYCDCVIEVHDARIPFSGRNPNLSRLLGHRPTILALNKIDLADSVKTESLISLMKNEERAIVLTDCKQQHHKSIKELMKEIVNMVGCNESVEEAAVKVMVVGMPNVGKSSLINAMRRIHFGKGSAAKVGALPGMTRAIQTKVQISRTPPMYIYDTPGVMMPNIANEEVAMKLAIIGMLRDHLIGEMDLTDYLLFTLNQHQLFEYTNFYRLPSPCDDNDTVLRYIAKRIQALNKGGEYDYLRAAKHFLNLFRSGKLGKITLDDSTCHLAERMLV